MARNNRAKVKKEDKKITLTRRELEKIIKESQKEGRVEGINVTSRVFMAVMAENHNLTEDEIFYDMETASRWIRYIHLHILAIKEVDEIIERKGGVSFEEC